MANPWGKPDADRSIIIYVPTTEYDKSVSESVIKKRVKDTVKFLNKLFGGTTRVIGTGSWVNDGQTINEKVVMVETMTNDKDLKKNASRLKAWVQRKKKEWKQHSISVEYEEDMSWR